MKTRLLFLILVASLTHSSICVGNESMGTPAAKVEFAKADAARDRGDFAAARDAYHRATEIDPNFAKAHEGYILMTQLASEKGGSHENERGQVVEQLQNEYEVLLRGNPGRAVYPWALALMNLEHHPQQAESFLREALRIDPNFAPAFNLLSVIESSRGDLEAERNDLRKAVEANPNDPEYLLNYVDAVKDVNPEESARLSLELLQKFPDTDSAAFALFFLADQAPTRDAKIRYLETLKSKFLSKSAPSEGGMRMLFALYDQTDHNKALTLAKEVSKAKPQELQWGKYVQYEEKMILAERLLAEGNVKAASETLATVDPTGYTDHMQLDMLRARIADTDGDTQKAYEDLLKIFANDPTDQLESAIATYGRKLGKTQVQTEARVSEIRDANAKPATPFTLPGYGEVKKVSLSDFRGKVVLLTFWYPECGPCRGEFPYLKTVLDKYKRQGFVTIAVNMVRAQDDYVLPLLKGYQLDFIPAQDDDKVSKSYDPEGYAPYNLLIGRDGRIWFHLPHPIFDSNRQRSLELRVEWLLNLHYVRDEE